MAKLTSVLTAIGGIGLWGTIALAPALAIPAEPAMLLAQNGAEPVLNLDLLKNLAYNIPNLGSINLNDGTYLGNNGNIEMIRPLAIGDVDQDGDQDAAVLLRSQSLTGPEQLIYLAVVTAGPDGAISNPDTYFLGDRVRVQSLTIKNGQIRLNMLKHQEGDPECCPSSLVSMAYQLDNQAGTLQPITLSEEQRQEIHIQDLPPVDLPGSQDQPFQPPLDQFQIQL